MLSEKSCDVCVADDIIWVLPYSSDEGALEESKAVVGVLDEDEVPGRSSEKQCKLSGMLLT